MDKNILSKIEKIFTKQKEILSFDFDRPEIRSNQIESIIATEVQHEIPEIRQRVHSELLGLGPIDSLLLDATITEILVNRYDEIFFEKNGILIKHTDHFFSEISYANTLDRLAQQAGTYFNREKPFIEAQIGRMRVTIIFSEISRGNSLLSIRLQPDYIWTFADLLKTDWCSEKQYSLTQEIFKKKKNFLVVGGTGSGKTSLLQSFISQLSITERGVIIEDTQELQIAQSGCVSLLTREDPSHVVPDITMDDLLKRALRLRPDRLIIGEIRGAEAKSLLMAMATGHEGSFGSLHARTAEEAILRLEMLIQIGAPQWSIHSIRRLIGMTIHNIFVVHKKNGKRCLEGIYQISSIEEVGPTLYKLDE